MEVFKPKDALDWVFVAGVILKGLDGVLELLGGLLLLFVTPESINRIVAALSQHELSEDPQDFVATHLRDAAHQLTNSVALFAAVYLLSHGIVKLVLVVAVLLEKAWAYPWMIVFLVLFIAYQLYRMTFTPGVGLAALTLLDAAVAWLTYREYRKRTS